MHSNSARIAIVFRNTDNQHKKNMFVEFTNYVSEHSSKKIAGIFQISDLETTTVEKNARNKTELFNPHAVQNVCYTTKKPIVDVDVFEEALRVLVKWYHSLDEIKPSIELVTSFVKFPLYYRNNKFIPPRTYYDLDLVNEKDQNLIDEINKVILKAPINEDVEEVEVEENVSE